MTAAAVEDSIYGVSDELESNALSCALLTSSAPQAGNDIVETCAGRRYRLGRVEFFFCSWGPDSSGAWSLALASDSHTGLNLCDSVECLPLPDAA